MVLNKIISFISDPCRVFVCLFVFLAVVGPATGMFADNDEKTSWRIEFELETFTTQTIAAAALNLAQILYRALWIHMSLHCSLNTK